MNEAKLKRRFEQMREQHEAFKIALQEIAEMRPFLENNMPALIVTAKAVKVLRDHPVFPPKPTKESD
jgi:hypothetical protein